MHFKSYISSIGHRALCTNCGAVFNNGSSTCLKNANGRIITCDAMIIRFTIIQSDLNVNITLLRSHERQRLHGVHGVAEQLRVWSGDMLRRDDRSDVCDLDGVDELTTSSHSAMSAW